MKSLAKVVAFVLASLVVASLLLVWVIYQPRLRPPGNNAKISAKVDPIKLERHVRRVVELGPRDWQHAENLDRVANYIISELRSYGFKPEIQQVEAEGYSFKNILVKTGAIEGPVTVIGAHYDVCDALPGADDNASGVAGLLEIARHLSEKPSNHSIELAFYTLEEPPFFGTEKMGSFVHAKALNSRNANVKGMISVEMIGYFTDEANSQEYPMPLPEMLYPSVGNFIAVVGNLESRKLAYDTRESLRTSGMPAYSFNAPAFIPGLTYSDHWPFWVLGYEAVMVTDTAFHRNKAYHTEQDTAGRLDFRRMAQVVDGLISLLSAPL